MGVTRTLSGGMEGINIWSTARCEALARQGRQLALRTWQSNTIAEV